MTSDLVSFLGRHVGRKVHVLGHSMGAKVAMGLALSEPGWLDSLICVDMPPAKATLSSSFRDYLQAMKKVEGETANGSKRDADEVLKEVEPELSVRQFLLTNYVLDPRTKRYRWRLPLDILDRDLDRLGDFPHPAPDSACPYTGPTLFIKGRSSPFVFLSGLPLQIFSLYQIPKKDRYIKDEHHLNMHRFFPAHRLEVLPGGHWGVCSFIDGSVVDCADRALVHAESSEAFLNLVQDFIDNLGQASGESMSKGR